MGKELENTGATAQLTTKEDKVVVLTLGLAMANAIEKMADKAGKGKKKAALLRAAKLIERACATVRDAPNI